MAMFFRIPVLLFHSNCQFRVTAPRQIHTIATGAFDIAFEQQWIFAPTEIVE
jgi:hypothetical protein